MALETLQKRIDKKTLKRRPNECWPWLGYINQDGEARVWVNDEIGSISVPNALYLARGEKIPQGKEALSCPILKDCANPDHHSLADRSEIADRILWKKGLHRRPPRRGGPSRKLSDEQVKQIFLSNEETKVLAERYGVTAGQISNIRAGRTHSELTEILRPAQPRERKDGRSGGQLKALEAVNR